MSFNAISRESCRILHCHSTSKESVKPCLLCLAHGRRCARNTSCALTHRGDIASLTIWGPGRPSLLFVCDSVLRGRAMMVGRRIQGPAEGAAPCDVFTDCLYICCSVSSCSVVEAETCSSGCGGASFDEPLPSSFDSARDSGASLPWHADEPCMPEVVENMSRPSAVEVQPKQRSPFEMKSSLLRAVPTDVVLRGCARLLSSSAGSEATYQCSTPTDHLEAFISHNWSVSRIKKWVALSVHFNFLSALFCGVVTAATLCVATSFG